MPALVSTPTDQSLVGRSKSAKHLITTLQNDFDSTKKVKDLPLSQEPDWPPPPKGKAIGARDGGQTKSGSQEIPQFFQRDVI